MRRTQKGGWEYRLVCNDPEHSAHAWHVAGPRDKAQKRADINNADPVSDPLTCIPYHRTCRPFRIESRFVTEWTADLDDAEIRVARLSSSVGLFDEVRS